MPQPSPPPSSCSSSSATTRPGAKFSSILKTPVDSKYIDTVRATRWLVAYLHKEGLQDDEPLISAVLINHLRSHRMPCPKVAQVQLAQLSLMPPDKVHRLMRKFWDMLLGEQANALQRHPARSSTSVSSGASKTSSLTSTRISSAAASSPPMEPKEIKARKEYARSSTGLVSESMHPALARTSAEPNAYRWREQCAPTHAYGYSQAYYV